MAKSRHVGGIVLSLALASPLAAQPPTTAFIGTPPQPGWNLLSAQQKAILTPLAAEWDKMDNVRRKKWLGIAERYPGMKPEEQRRMQERMREWASLSPEQRAKVRDSYREFNQLPSEQKQTVKQKWEAYSSLPPAEQQRLRQEGRSSRLLAPPPVAEPAAAPQEQAAGEGESTATAQHPGEPVKN